ncbi:MAG: DUF3500 domain-containing protein [Acidobacteria bacterium]|nr:DUF3500 domain-containing protein [Acidobacteriota bacterium]MBI3262325.1 DUF3500 domain-containing protein [Acidobacteriota bacterium]
MRLVLNVAVAVTLLGLVALAGPRPNAEQARGITPADKMVSAARAFLATLDAAQVATARFSFDADERFNWHFIPRERKGLSLKAMTPPQRQAALELVKTGLSEPAFNKTETIRSLENVLRELEKGGRLVRDPEMYFVTIFGEPSPSGVWGWRYEGHHIAQNWTIVDGLGIATSPQFFGANPAEVRAGPMKGTRALAAEEDLARKLVESLKAEQLTGGVVAEKAPNDIATMAERQAAIQADTGVAYGSLGKDQQAMLLALIEAYANAQPRELALDRIQRIRRAGIDRVKFAWMGPVQKGQGHYYRIQGPSFLIEYDNTQNDANHIHAVWRDFKGDFGRDLLAEHYKTSPHR